MTGVIRVFCVLILGSILSGCITVAAPGADQVVITRNPADVAPCFARGNIELKVMQNIDPLVARNMAIGLNANYILNTGTGGIAYQCNK